MVFCPGFSIHMHLRVTRPLTPLYSTLLVPLSPPFSWRYLVNNTCFTPFHYAWLLLVRVILSRPVRYVPPFHPPSLFPAPAPFGSTPKLSRDKGWQRSCWAFPCGVPLHNAYKIENSQHSGPLPPRQTTQSSTGPTPGVSRRWMEESTALPRVPAWHWPRQTRL